MVLEWLISAYIIWHFSTFSTFLSLHFHEKTLRIGEVENLSFFEWPFFDLFFKKIFLLHHSMVKIYSLAWMALNFDDYSGFQLKIIHAN